MNQAETSETNADLIEIRNRLRDLDTKAYYLLVALSFIYGRGNEGVRSLKLALSLTAISAVLPLQDFVKTRTTLRAIQTGKIAFLVFALVSILYWIIFVAGT